MLYQFYPHPKNVKKETTALVPSSSPKYGERYELGDSRHATRLGITVAEFARRCFVVRSAWTKCLLNPGDTVYPVNRSDYEKNGAMVVVSVAGDYRTMLDTEWPANDNPFIVAVRPVNGEGVIFCTNGWAIKENKHLNIGVENGTTSQTC